MKKKSLFLFVYLALGAGLVGWIGSWYAPAGFIVISFLVIPIETRKALWIGAGSIGTAYLVMSLWMLSQDQAGMIEKTGQLLGGLPPVMMVVITVLTGSVTGLLSAWLGNALGNYIRQKF